MSETFPSGEKKVTIEDALTRIQVAEQEERTRGRFDEEGSAFAYIRERLEATQITPEQALEQVKKIQENRQDYN